MVTHRLHRRKVLLVADTMIYPVINRELPPPSVPESLVSTSISIARPIAARIARPTGAQLRQRFVVQTDPAGAPPPMAQLLRGGRGGEVKLKVYLSLLWVAVADPYDVSMPGSSWAQLAGLPDPRGRGAHRVNGALRKLVDAHLLQAQAKPGQASRFLLLEETGTGRKYQPPGKRIGTLKSAGKDFTEHLYLQVPNSLWTNGWLARLNGPALAMLLVLIAQAGGRSTEDLWFSPGVADQRFHLSAETRKRGLDQLAELKLVTVGRRPVARSAFDTVRLRNTYSLSLKQLDEQAPPPRPEL